MTVDKLPNQDDILLRTGNKMFDVTTLNHIPNEVVTSSSGGSSVTALPYGLAVETGGTSGDTASARAGHTYTAFGLSGGRVLIQYYKRGTDANGLYSDEFEIGFGKDFGEEWVGLDLKTGEFISGGVAVDATGQIVTDASQTWLLIETDGSSTRFQTPSSNGYVEVSATPAMGNHNVYSVGVHGTSTGNGDAKVFLQHMSAALLDGEY